MDYGGYRAMRRDAFRAVLQVKNDEFRSGLSAGTVP